MILIKLGILLTGFTYAGLLPFAVKRSLIHVDFDPQKETLSFLSNKNLYEKRFVSGYKRMLFTTAILNYFFFWLLSEFYDLGEYEAFMKQIDYSFAFLALLAFVPHNIKPYSFKNLQSSIQRFIHNILAIIVFITLPVLIIMFQTAIMDNLYFMGISGLAIISVVIILTFLFTITKGINGVTEIIFINGISIWSIYVTILTFIK